MKKEKYYLDRHKFQSGDKVLFRAYKWYVTAAIWICSILKLSSIGFFHIGMIIVREGRVLVIESALYKKQLCVQINAFSDVLRDYKGQVCVRHLICNRDDKFCKILDDTTVELRGKPYEKDFDELIGSVIPIIHNIFGHKPDLSSIFCYELVAEYDKRLGYLPADIPSNEYGPGDYDFGKRVDKLFSMNSEPVCMSNLIEMKR